mmetsp:Transcript_6857/g.24958  ORF Transcript_6857/g.24958 Transcript_6857/m.24958 type:complete len:292 (-) Transcript_6857:2980-3855(-)
MYCKSASRITTSRYSSGSSNLLCTSSRVTWSGSEDSPSNKRDDRVNTCRFFVNHSGFMLNVNDVTTCERKTSTGFDAPFASMTRMSWFGTVNSFAFSKLVDDPDPSSSPPTSRNTSLAAFTNAVGDDCAPTALFPSDARATLNPSATFAGVFCAGVAIAKTPSPFIITKPLLYIYSSECVRVEPRRPRSSPRCPASLSRAFRLTRHPHPASTPLRARAPRRRVVRDRARASATACYARESTRARRLHAVVDAVVSERRMERDRATQTPAVAIDAILGSWMPARERRRVAHR